MHRYAILLLLALAACASGATVSNPKSYNVEGCQCLLRGPAEACIGDEYEITLIWSGTSGHTIRGTLRISGPQSQDALLLGRNGVREVQDTWICPSTRTYKVWAGSDVGFDDIVLVGTGCKVSVEVHDFVRDPLAARGVPADGELLQARAGTEGQSPPESIRTPSVGMVYHSDRDHCPGEWRMERMSIPMSGNLHAFVGFDFNDEGTAVAGSYAQIENDVIGSVSRAVQVTNGSEQIPVQLSWQHPTLGFGFSVSGTYHPGGSAAEDTSGVGFITQPNWLDHPPGSTIDYKKPCVFAVKALVRTEGDVTALAQALLRYDPEDEPVVEFRRKP